MITSNRVAQAVYVAARQAFSASYDADSSFWTGPSGLLGPVRVLFPRDGIVARISP